MDIKRLTLLMSLCLIALGLHSQPITEQEALDRALQYMNSSDASAAARRMAAPVRGGSVRFESARIESDKIYAFNMEGGGFIIASADSRTLPVLGYSTTGSIDWERMPANIRDWLRNYDLAVESLGDCAAFKDGIATDGSGFMLSDNRSERAPVDALIKSHWNQDIPYWDQTPLYEGLGDEYKGERCYTGCAATALAQVLNYYQWPKVLLDGIPDYDCYSEYDGEVDYWRVDALPPVIFDWDNMLDDYKVYNPETGLKETSGTDEQKRAVATLMRYCGQSLEMSYGPPGLGGSGSYPTATPKALVEYFGYSAAQLYYRNKFSVDKWEEIVYGEVSSGRPVIYGGFSDVGGHAFVCDGYDGNGLFHINWGWGGVIDGFFALSVLNPYASSDPDVPALALGFNMNESAVMYIEPGLEAQPQLKSDKVLMYQNKKIILVDDADNQVNIHLIYYGDDAEHVYMDHALGTVREDGQAVPVFMGDLNDSILYRNNYFEIEIDSTAFQPGQSMTLYPMIRFRTPGAQWQFVPPLKSHIIAGRTADGRFFIEINDVDESDLRLFNSLDLYISKGTGRLDQRCDLTLRLRNPLETDYVDSIVIRPVYYGHIQLDQINDTTSVLGESLSCGAFLRGGQEEEITFSFTPKQGGLVKFYVNDNYFLNRDILYLELTDDTLANYDSYIDNKSYFAHKDGQWYYNIELCDKEFSDMPYWIPSDSIGLRASSCFNDDISQTVMLRDEVREYLMDLPLKGGSGDYRFTWSIPIELGPSGTYKMDSYLGEWIDGKLTVRSCLDEYSFRYSNPTKVSTIEAIPADEPYFDILGRPVNGIPTKKGIYIRGNKKVYIK